MANASMWRQIAAVLLIVLGFLTVTFFRHYSGHLIPYPFFFWSLGLTMFLFGYLLVRYIPSDRSQAAARQIRQLIGELKASGEKIKVDFKDCEILEHNYSEHKETYGRDSLFPSLAGGPSLNELDDETGGTGIANVCQSVILFSYPNERTGHPEKFMSQIISKDKITLSFYLDQQKQTTLYVDKSDRSRYYFDLDFLATP